VSSSPELWNWKAGWNIFSSDWTRGQKWLYLLIFKKREEIMTTVHESVSRWFVVDNHSESAALDPGKISISTAQ
jgi:hypothetical protein